ncbi:MAG: hypothetical protein QF662_04880, partial [Phycisphaerae bacterium]|nr:hypothetical protein [Phycisphaerae bacterium]
MLKAVKKFLSQEASATVDVLSRLIETRTVNPPGDEHLVAAIVREVFDSAGIPYEIFEKEEGRTNVVARVGPASGQKVLISCHADTVPAGED